MKERNPTQTTILSSSMRISLEATPNSKNKVWEFSCHVKNDLSAAAVEGKKKLSSVSILLYENRISGPPNLLTNQKHKCDTRPKKKKKREREKGQTSHLVTSS